MLKFEIPFRYRLMAHTEMRATQNCVVNFWLYIVKQTNSICIF